MEELEKKQLLNNKNLHEIQIYNLSEVQWNNLNLTNLHVAFLICWNSNILFLSSTIDYRLFLSIELKIDDIYWLADKQNSVIFYRIDIVDTFGNMMTRERNYFKPVLSTTVCRYGLFSEMAEKKLCITYYFTRKYAKCRVSTCYLGLLDH